jgi:hypothetical protein
MPTGVGSPTIELQFASLDLLVKEVGRLKAEWKPDILWGWQEPDEHRFTIIFNPPFSFTFNNLQTTLTRKLPAHPLL